MAVRLNQLAAGGSGVDPRVLDALVAALDSGAIPAVHQVGAIGTGDLCALADLALALCGDRAWHDRDARRCVTLSSSDALAMISSNAATIGEAVLAQADLDALLRASEVVAALSFVALGGAAEAYGSPVQNARAHPGQLLVATRMRRLLGVGPTSRAGRRLQDPFSLRAVPQVHGTAVDAVERLGTVLDVEINARAENPLLDLATSDAWHNANFHTGYLAHALDSARAAVYPVAELSAARLGDLVDPDFTGLAAFLAEGSAGQLGGDGAGVRGAGRRGVPAPHDPARHARQRGHLPRPGGPRQLLDARRAAGDGVRVRPAHGAGDGAGRRRPGVGDGRGGTRRACRSSTSLRTAYAQATEVLGAERADRSLSADLAAAELLLNRLGWGLSRVSVWRAPGMPRAPRDDGARVRRVRAALAALAAVGRAGRRRRARRGPGHRDAHAVHGARAAARQRHARERWAGVGCSRWASCSWPRPRRCRRSAPDLWLMLAHLRGARAGVRHPHRLRGDRDLAPGGAGGPRSGGRRLRPGDRVPQLALTPAAPWLLAMFGFPLVAAFGAVPLIARGLDAAPREAHHGAARPAAPRRRPRPQRAGPSTARRIWRPLLALLLATSAGGALLTFTAQLAPDTGTAVLALVVPHGGRRPVPVAARRAVRPLGHSPVRRSAAGRRRRRASCSSASRATRGSWSRVRSSPAWRTAACRASRWCRPSPTARRPAPGLRRLERRVRPRHRAGRGGGGRDRRAELLPRRVLRAGLRLPGRAPRSPAVARSTAESRAWRAARRRSVLGVGAASDRRLSGTASTVTGDRARGRRRRRCRETAPTGSVSAFG